MRKRITVTLGLPIVVAIGLSACSSSNGAGHGANNGKVTQGASVTLTINGEPTTLDPQARDDGNLRDIDDNIYETLLTRSADGTKLEPLLASAMPNRINPTTWEFQLRQSVKFTD